MPRKYPVNNVPYSMKCLYYLDCIDWLSFDEYFSCIWSNEISICVESMKGCRILSRIPQAHGIIRLIKRHPSAVNGNCDTRIKNSWTPSPNHKTSHQYPVDPDRLTKNIKYWWTLSSEDLLIYDNVTENSFFGDVHWWINDRFDDRLVHVRPLITNTRNRTHPSLSSFNPFAVVQ